MKESVQSSSVSMQAASEGWMHDCWLYVPFMDAIRKPEWLQHVFLDHAGVEENGDLTVNKFKMGKPQKKTLVKNISVEKMGKILSASSN